MRKTTSITRINGSEMSLRNTEKNKYNIKNLKPFQKGRTLNPGGKPVGARNLLSRLFIEALRNDFDQHGEQAICDVRENDPAIYLRVIASIVPKEMTINEGDTAIERILDTIADEEIATFVEGVRLLTVAASGGKAIAQEKTRKQPAGIH